MDLQDNLGQSSHYTFSEAKFTGPVIPPVTYDISKLPRVANIEAIGTVTGTKYKMPLQCQKITKAWQNSGP